MTHTFTASPPEAIVDFHAVRDDAFLGVSRALVRGLEPSEGDLIHLRDPEGNQCEAVVTAVRERSLLTRLIWETWMSAADEEDLFPRTSEPVEPITESEPSTGLRPGELVEV